MTKRFVPRWAAALLFAIVAVTVLAIAIAASLVGPLEAHPPEREPEPPPLPQDSVPVTLPTIPTSRQEGHADGSWLWWVFAVLAGLVLVFLVLALIRALRQLRYRMAKPPTVEAQAAAAGLSVGWVTADPEQAATDERTFDPARAADDIVASWTVVEAAADRLGHSRARSSTPTEFLADVVERYGDPVLREEAGRSVRASEALLPLYHRARFDLAALAPDAALTARAAVRALLSAWNIRETSAPDRAESSSPGRHR